jgi:uncharacterized membrane protein YfcA
MEWMHLLLDIIKQEYLIILSFFVISIIYSTVGFGGGSSYSAVLSLTEIPFVEVRAISLLCNIVVVFNSTIKFIESKLLNWKKVLPLVLFSVPFAFFGGYIKINHSIFHLVLGFSLVISAILMLFGKFFIIKVRDDFNYDYSFVKNALIGGFIGFISGMVGIGGGVFLAPFLHLTKWDSPRRIVAISSFFILLNSISGLTGQMFNPQFNINIPLTIVLVFTVFIGGFIGVGLSLKKINIQNIKRITALLITIVGIKLIYSNIQ